MVLSDQQQFEKYIKAEIKNIDVDKFFEGIKLQRDPGAEYVENWVMAHSKKFRDKWTESVCSKCSNWNCIIEHSRICCLQMLKTCDGFRKEDDES